jgi:F-type H+-transporting ATPase subunit alpha
MTTMPETKQGTARTEWLVGPWREALRDNRITFTWPPHPEEFGIATFVGESVIRVRGLDRVQAMERVLLPEGRMGMAFDLSAEAVSVVCLDAAKDLEAGDRIRRSGRVLDVPVGETLLGRVLDPLGRPLDSGPALDTQERRPLERAAPAIMDRSPVTEPLRTGLQAIDALIPIGQGQRELILGDRQTGKTAIAVDTIINQRDQDTLCIYCAIGQRMSAVARVRDEIKEYGAPDRCILVVARGDDTPGLNFIAPYAATSMAEAFAEQGRDVLIVYDDLTRHARAYRELSLLMRRPPGREAYPGDIFYVHARLLERATHWREDQGGGSLTALPIIETEAQNLAAYIPTNLISITDGQIYLSPELFQQGLLPAVDVGLSVSRVGGKTQRAAYREIAGDLRLSYAQFQELEAFSRFGTRLDEDTRQTLARGRRVRAVLKQDRYAPLTPVQQIAVLWAVNNGLFDAVTLADLPAAKQAVADAAAQELTDLAERIEQDKSLRDEDREQLRHLAESAVQPFVADNRQPPEETEADE